MPMKTITYYNNIFCAFERVSGMQFDCMNREGGMDAERGRRFQRDNIIHLITEDS